MDLKVIGHTDTSALYGVVTRNRSGVWVETALRVLLTSPRH